MPRTDLMKVFKLMYGSYSHKEGEYCPAEDRHQIYLGNMRHEQHLANNQCTSHRVLLKQMSVDFWELQRRLYL